MTTPRSALLLLTVILLTAASAGAVQISTSARVQIVPGVEIERITSDLDNSTAPENAVAFHLLGPPDRTVNITWTTGMAPGRTAMDPEPTSRRHDDNGDLRVWLEEGATDGHLLIEYE